MNYVKTPLRSNDILKIKNDDKYCYIWSKLASLHPCNNDNSKKVSKYRQFFDELNFENFDFSDGLRCSDVHKFEKKNNLSINLFGLNFHQDRNKTET